MVDTISFRVDVSQKETDRGMFYTALEVICAINGTELDFGAFDVGHVLASCVSSDYFMPVTCGCGDSGCLGVDEVPTLELTEHAVGWVFPDDYFRTAFPVTLIKPGMSLVFRFEKSNYLAALAALTKEMQAHCGTGTMTSFKIGPYPLESDFGRNVEDIVQDQKDWLQEKAQRKAFRQSVFGDKLGSYLEATLPDGTTLSFGLAQFADNLAFEDVKGTNNILGDKRDAAYSKYGRMLCSGNDTCFAMIRSMGPDFFGSHFMPECVTSFYESLDELETVSYLRDNWNDILFSVVTPPITQIAPV